ncbi:MAG: hypothetical protein HQM08_29255 [Candidatus Riflebacteria bacterium]|nr:hypothetical protein [Candidatus Riflebacteria bacterium]
MSLNKEIMKCDKCDYNGKFRSELGGSPIIEYGLWFILLAISLVIFNPAPCLFAVIYSYGRSWPIAKVCPKCGHKILTSYRISDPG